jgi:3',5'-cyclic AMP phosphodiesterase CpdA
MMGSMANARMGSLSAIIVCTALVGWCGGLEERQALGGDASGGLDAGSIAVPATTATVVVLPDTQYYTDYFLDIFPAQTRWIVQQKLGRNIALALHVGDIVDFASELPEWDVAGAAMRVLDGKVPYVLVPGNHDEDTDRQGPINDYFNPETMPWITGTMVAGHIENNYALVDIGPQPWLVLGLEYGPRNAVLTWADGVLKAYPDRPAIIVTHAYLYPDGTRYHSPDQSYYPVGYTPAEGINDGEMIWQNLIVPNPNVRLVFCGHYGVGRLTSTRPDGSRVHQLLSDYQWRDDLGGSGFLRTLEFDYAKMEIRVATYSPYLGQFLTDDANQFTVSLEL